MSKNNKMLTKSEEVEIAKELGVYDTVKEKGWGEVSSKDCGNIVKKALERSERNEMNN
jgi:small acid-soluble spore protein F (minor alpha/beta-type SASP)